MRLDQQQLLERSIVKIVLLLQHTSAAQYLKPLLLPVLSILKAYVRIYASVDLKHAGEEAVGFVSTITVQKSQE